MGFILKFLAGPLGMYSLIAVGVLLVGSIGYARIEHSNAARYGVERDQARADAKGLKISVQSKDRVIEQQQVALQDWKTSATESRIASEAAGSRAEDYKTQLSAARHRINALSEADRELPDCQKLLATDLAAVCPGAGERVRQWVQQPADRGIQGPNH